MVIKKMKKNKEKNEENKGKSYSKDRKNLLQIFMTRALKVK